MIRILLITLFAGLVSGCSSDTTESDYPQVDRVGRPGILELLVRNNTNMNDWNTFTPATDISSLADPMRGEMAAFIDDIVTYGNSHGMTPMSYPMFFNGFLPDVIRIDTDLPNSGYNIEVVTNELGAPMLTGGRMFSEDAIDILMSMLFDRDSSGTTMKDNVSYAGPGAGVNPAQPGKHALLATFPYLASPN